MAVQSAFGTISILSTDTVGTDKVISGLAFQPKVIFFWGSGATSGTDAMEAGDYRAGFGFAISPTARRAVGGFSDHAVATTSCRAMYSDVGVFVTGTTAIDGALDLESIESAGFTCTIDDQFPVNHRVHWLAIGGPEIVDLAIGSFQTPAAAGTQDVTDVGFEPDFVFFAKAGRSANPAPDNVQDGMLGFGAWSDVGQWTVAVDGNTAVALGTTQTMRYQRSGECLSGFNAASTAIEARATLTGALSNGFRLNWLEVGGTSTWNFYLAMRGGGYASKMGDFTNTLNENITVSGFGFEPSCCMVFSTVAAEDAVDTPRDHNILSIGFASSPSSRGAMYARDTDAQGTNTACARGVEYDAVLVSESGAVVDGLMDLQSFNADGATFIMDDAFPAAGKFMVIAFGPPTVSHFPHEGTKPWSTIWRPGRA